MLIKVLTGSTNLAVVQSVIGFEKLVRKAVFLFLKMPYQTRTRDSSTFLSNLSIAGTCDGVGLPRPGIECNGDSKSGLSLGGHNE